MAKKLKSFDQYVKEAQREDLELELPNEETLTITYPTGATARKLRELALDEDAELEEQVKVLLGEENGTKFLNYYEDAPADVLNEVFKDILEEFDLTGE